MGIECESGISYDENLVGLTKPIAFALFKHKTQAVITLGIVLLFSTADRTIFTLTADGVTHRQRVGFVHRANRVDTERFFDRVHEHERYRWATGD